MILLGLLAGALLGWVRGNRASRQDASGGRPL